MAESSKEAHSMAKKYALVTGGMGGIGQAICRELHKQNIQVIAAYHRSNEDAATWQENEKKAGFDFLITPIDVTNFNSCNDMVKQIIAEVGPIDILVNNAGITRDKSLCNMEKEDWDIVISTDLNSVFYMTRSVVAEMKKRKYGRIINISSINGQKGQYGQVNYAAAKAGMHGFTKSLALELAKHGITVNTISPGYVETEMITKLSADVRDMILQQIPMGRFAQPIEIARVVSFLADENNSYISGANISINGAQYLS
jgi:acetoacetyl-CoA reductase